MKIIKRIGLSIIYVLIVLTTYFGATAGEIPFVQLEDLSITNVVNFFEFNETYADSLYYSITNPYNFYNESDFDIDDYLTITEANDLYNDTNTHNTTDEIFNAINNGTFYLLSNPYNFYNESDFDIDDYILSSVLLGYGYYNESDFDINDYYITTIIDDIILSIGNFSAWDSSELLNKTSDTYVETESDPLFSAWDSSELLNKTSDTYVETESDPVWLSDKTDYSTTAEADLLYSSIGSNPFDQSLNTSDNVQFNDITINSIIFDENKSITFNETCMTFKVSETYINLCV